MRAVIQRVSSASIKTDSGHHDNMGEGLLVLLGIEDRDDEGDVDWLSGKIARLRIFNDQNGVMNLSLLETGGGCMLVSQFTLFASSKKGNRPSWIRAAGPEKAIPLYELFLVKLEALLKRPVKTGIFGDHMEVSLVNDGPVTLIIDSKARE